jgi:hypothetical protein
VITEADAARPRVDNEALDQSDRIVQGDAVQLAVRAHGILLAGVDDASVVAADAQLPPLNVEEVGDGRADTTRAA